MGGSARRKLDPESQSGALPGAGYASAESALWYPDGPDGPTLLAWATQVMFFTRFD